MGKRTIEIPKSLKCPECGSNDLRGRGKDWRLNPNGKEPPRIRVQLYRCVKCGLIFADGEVKTTGGK